MPESDVRVAVAGARGKMGRVAVESLRRKEGVVFAGSLVRKPASAEADEFDSFDALLAARRPDVLVDFTLMPASKEIALAAIARGVRPVIGTSGYGESDIEELRAACAKSGVGALLVPNFALGAVLMMKFAAEAARHYRTAEIIEMHESGKRDAPSGTAMATARRIAESGTFERAPTTALKAKGARGAGIGGVGVHSLRLPGVVAHQEVRFGGQGEMLSIRHDSSSRESFMPGMLLAVRAAANATSLIVGLEGLL